MLKVKPMGISIEELSVLIEVMKDYEEFGKEVYGPTWEGAGYVSFQLLGYDEQDIHFIMEEGFCEDGNKGSVNRIGYKMPRYLLLNPSMTLKDKIKAVRIGEYAGVDFVKNPNFSLSHPFLAYNYFQKSAAPR